MGDRTLGAPDLQCLLLIVMRNANTDSPWPLTNNPFAKYNDPERVDSNLQIPLWQLVRASTAAPVYFKPEEIRLSDEQKFKFVDGGVTPHNNPSFLLYRMATAPEYRLGWDSGEDKMMLVSVGTGSMALVDPDLLERGQTIFKNATQMPGVLMGGSSVDQDINCRAIGRCVGGAVIDNEIGDMIPRDGDPLTGSRIPLDQDLGRAFLYARFDPAIGPKGLKELGLEHIASENVVAMDKVEFLAEMQAVGRAYAARHVDMSPFARFA